MANTRVKICGMTRPEDAAKAAELGADAIGLNFVAGPRKVTPEVAKSIYWSIKRPQYTKRGETSLQTNLEVVVLCGSSREKLPDSLAWHEVSGLVFFPHIYQIYGEHNEEMNVLGALSQQWWRVVPVSSRDSIVEAALKIRKLVHRPTGVLFDAISDGKFGGTGRSFAWEWLTMTRAAGELKELPPIILAGGLTPENVAEAIRIAQPYAVDVSSGVEVAGKPGVKDPIKMRDFIQAVRGAG